MALSKAEGRRCAASLVITAYFYVRLIPQDLRALHLEFFTVPSDLWSARAPLCRRGSRGPMG